MNITRKVDLKKLFHIKSKENCSDVGKRTDKVTSKTVKPNSDWLAGKPWMRLSLEEATDQKFIKPIKNLKLTHEEKKVVKKGIIFDGCDDEDDRFAVIMAAKVDVQRTAECEAQANYVYSPTKRKFSVFIRIIALVLRAVRRFKMKRILKRINSLTPCYFQTHDPARLANLG